MTELVTRGEVLRSQPEQISESDIYGPLQFAKEVTNKESSLGVRLVGNGVVAALRTGPEVDVADFCLQNRSSYTETVQRFRLHPAGTTTDGGKLFTGSIPGAKEGDPYGFRVSGLYEPPYYLHDYNQLLLDPHAKQISFQAHQANRYEPFPERPYSIITDTSFDWRGERRPRIDPDKRVIYEAHLKGTTKLHPAVPEHLRGTYAGMAHPAVIRHLQELGVTSVEFLPLQQSLSESLTQPGRLPNYWGYNTIGFFAPAVEYAADKRNPADEFKTMVKALHNAGLEVIMDVVYNHTGEGGAGGPSYLLKGLDNRGMYRIDQHGNYIDYTGCGNTLDLSRPAALQLVMDSLRYWVGEMHVDGFRFDLATALVRDRYGNIDLNGPFMQAVRHDRMLQGKVLIAEPWDATWGSNVAHGFKRAPSWRTWNDTSRDKTRSFWNGGGADINDLAYVLAGSEKKEGVVNFVTAHDGFTARDVVSYSVKHNQANGEDNRDGENNNNANNHGYEGKTNDPAIRAARLRAVGNMLGTLALADGTPMLLGGDELWRTQRGNNNAYCQDNELSWLHWDLDAEGEYIRALTRALFRIRRENDRAGELAWLGVWGEPMRGHNDWHNGTNALAMFKGARRLGRDVLYYANGMDRVVDARLPLPRRYAGKYVQLINTGTQEITLDRPKTVPSTFQLAPRSTLILRRH
jgi:glycogen operon protein